MLRNPINIDSKMEISANKLQYLAFLILSPGFLPSVGLKVVYKY